MPGRPTDKAVEPAARYSSVKYILAIVNIAYLLLLLLAFLTSGAHLKLSSLTGAIFANKTLALLLYLSVLLAGYSILEIPLNFYRSYLLERRFGLSNQKIKSWVAEQLKAGVLSYIASAIAFGFLYYFLRRYPLHWWIIVALLWLFFNLLLARIFPLVILPLFFKYRRLDREDLRGRIIKLAGKMRVPILDVFEIDFSKKTNKSNAAFIGWGKSRRVILTDTLSGNYSDDEIEAILAHEFAHYKLMHLIKLTALNFLGTITTFYLIFKTGGYLAGFFGVRSLSDIASLAVIIFYLVAFDIVTRPLHNYFSRRMEKNADMLALKITRGKDAFISMMDKLASQNLADRDPRRWIKFFFFDHPSIAERIELARTFK